MAPFQITDGDIATLQTLLELYANRGRNTVTGTLQSMINATSLKVFESAGLNTISGQIDNIPSTITYFDIKGASVNLEYTTKTWASSSTPGVTGVQYVYIKPSDTSFTTAEASQLVIDLAASTWSTYPNTNKRVTTPHNKLTLTPEAQDAIISLAAQGVGYFIP